MQTTTSHVTAPVGVTETVGIQQLRPRISWGAVMAGAILALVVQLLLQMLGAGIGLSTVDPLRPGDTPSATAFATTAGIWWAVGGLIAAYVGGWLAGKLAGVSRPGDGAWHGLMSWAVSTLVTVYVLSTAAGSLLSGASNVAGTAASATATAATGAAASNPGVASEAARAATAARNQLSAPGTEQKAREAADATARNASRAMLGGFLALALGSLLASLGGRAGRARTLND